MMRTWNWIPVCLLALACTKPPVEPPPPPPTPPGEAWLTPEQVTEKLTLSEVAEHEVGAVIPTTGHVTFDDQRVTHVFSPVTGRITRIIATPGQRVKKGDPLCIIESPDVGSAFSDLAKASADMVAVEHDLKRKRALASAHAASAADLEAAEDAFGKAKAEMERAKQKASLLSRGAVNRVTQEFSLSSPIDGEVITRQASPGMEVQGQYSGGNAVELFTIGELDKVWVLADVFEMDLARVKTGGTARVQVVTYPDKWFTGTIEFVASTLDPATRTAKVRVAVDNETRELKPEMYASVEIAIGGKKTLTVPRKALLRLGEGMNVFVRKGTAPNGQIIFERVPVSVDEDAGDAEQVPVTHGLKAGQTVVIKGCIELLGLI